MFFAKIAVSKCINRLCLVIGRVVCVFPSVCCLPNQIHLADSSSECTVTWRNSIPQLVNLVQETSSVKLIDGCNWIDNDRKIVFLTDGLERLRGDQWLPAGRGNGVLLGDIRPGGINTGWALMQTATISSRWAAVQGTVCHRLRMHLIGGLTKLLQNPTVQPCSDWQYCCVMKPHYSFQWDSYMLAVQGRQTQTLSLTKFYIFRNTQICTFTT